MAACNGPCDQFEPGNETVWFKIYESGLQPGHDIGSSVGWKQSRLANNGWPVQVPRNLKPGNYLIRHEIIMIELNPPQHYPECAQLTVSGDGDALPGDEYLVSFPGAYSYYGEKFHRSPLP
jgi:hypothetical protein